MENATEALLFAGGILLGLIVVAMLVYMFSNIAVTQKTQSTQEELERLEKWNAEWEAYYKSYLYGAEVLTILNKAEENNLEYDNNSIYIVEVVIKDEDGNEIEDGKEYLLGKKSSIFECIEMKKHTETGRINSIVFKFVGDKEN